MPTQIVVLTEGDLESTLKRILEKVVVAEKTKYPPKRQSTEILLNREEVCSLLKISKPTLRSYVTRCVIPAYKIEGRVLFKREEVLNALKRTNDTN